MILEVLFEYIGDVVEELSVELGIDTLEDDNVFDGLVRKCNGYHKLAIMHDKIPPYCDDVLDMLIMTRLTSDDVTFMHYKQLYNM